MIKLIIVWALAALFTCNSLLITLRANFTVGTALVWALSAVFIAYGIFHKPIDAFLSGTAPGRVMRVIIIVGATVYAGMFLFVAVSGYTNTYTGDEKAIIVLGAGLRGERPGDMLRRRLQAGLTAWQQNPDALLVVTGGQGKQEAIPEAEAMQRWLLEQGVPEENIVVENKSTSTEENLAFARALLAERGVDANEPVAIVTNAFHCYRAGVLAGRLGFTEVRNIPATISLTTVIPSYMREVLAVLHLWVFRPAV